MTAGETFCGRLRAAMQDAGIRSGAELERRLHARYDGEQRSWHRQVTRWLQSQTPPSEKTIERLSDVLEKPPSYFTDGISTPKLAAQAADLRARLEQVAELAAANTTTLAALQADAEDQRSALEDVVSGLAARLDELESRVKALER